MSSSLRFRLKSFHLKFIQPKILTGPNQHQEGKEEQPFHVHGMGGKQICLVNNTNDPTITIW